MPVAHAFVVLGDAFVLLPCAAVVAVALHLRGAGAAARRWVLALAVGLGAVLAAKFAFDRAGWSLPAIGLYSVSGHAMLSAAVYPLLLRTLASELGPRAQRVALGLGGAVAVAVGVVLVAGRFHTVAETVLGAAIGLATLPWAGRAAPAGAARVILAGCLAACVLLPFAPAGGAGAAAQGAWTRMLRWSGVDARHVRIIEEDAASGRRVVVRRREAITPDPDAAARPTPAPRAR